MKSPLPLLPFMAAFWLGAMSTTIHAAMPPDNFDPQAIDSFVAATQVGETIGSRVKEKNPAKFDLVPPFLTISPLGERL